jgi:hypothetical protein
VGARLLFHREFDDRRLLRVQAEGYRRQSSKHQQKTYTADHLSETLSIHIVGVAR